MSKYRIVSELTINSTKDEKEFFYLQKSTSWLKRRLGFYWKFIHHHEDVRHHRPCFNSYQEAEAYLYKYYFKSYGEVFKNGNIYSFREYTFGY
jgi:hypothetical protein